MAKKTLTQLKEYFKIGKRPTQDQFGDLLDSFAHLNGPELARLIENINTEDGYLRLRSSNGTLITQISLQDIRNNMGLSTFVQTINGQSGNVTLDLEGPADVGSTRQGIAKFFTAESSNNIFHIKLPYKVNTHSAMFHIKAIGYDFNGADIIDVTWAGYCYQPMGALIKNKTHVNISTSITAGQYVGSDSNVYLWFKVPDTYYSTFKLDSMRVGNGTLLKQGDVQIIASPLTQL